MGIPGLTHHLRPYGGHTSIPQSKAKADSSYQTPAVIDGPSLAHALLRSGKYKLRKEDLIPRYDYEAIGKAAVSWLNWLRSYGFEMYVQHQITNGTTANLDQLRYLLRRCSSGIQAADTA
jgi:hypothetical protein